jgi:hypothetical protein
VSGRDLRTGSKAPSQPDDGFLATLGLAVGVEIRVDGERGTWTLVGLGRDGSVTVVGGPRRQWRSFRPEWCYPAQRSDRQGRVVAGRLPKKFRGLRRQWRAAQRGDAAAPSGAAWPPLTPGAHS